MHLRNYQPRGNNIMATTMRWQTVSESRFTIVAVETAVPLFAGNTNVLRYVTGKMEMPRDQRK